MLSKDFSISESQDGFLQTVIRKVRDRGGDLDESGIVRVALDLLKEFPIDFRAMRDEDALRAEGLKLIRMAEDAFRTLRAQLEEINYQDLLMEKSRDGVYMVNEKGNFTLMNRVAQQRMGYAHGDLMGKHFSEIVAPEYQDMLSEYLQKRIDGEDAPERYMIEIVAKNEERVPVELNITPLKDERGAMVAVFGIAREIRSGE